jgi:HlyD family secretion protein
VSRVKRTKVVWGVAALVVALVAWWLFSGDNAAATKKPSVATVERGSITAVVSSTGRVVPELDVDIKCKASGTVVAIARDVSDEVVRGELLVQLDPIDEERRVQQTQIVLTASRARVEQKRSALAVAERTLETNRARADSALQSAQARAADARAKAERSMQLLAKRLTSQEEYDTAETSAVQAEADLAAARTRLEEVKTEELSIGIARQDLQLALAQVQSDEITLADAKERLKETKVYAPIDGVVSGRSVEIGAIVISGINSIGGGTTLMTVADLSRIYVLASVDESDVGRVRAGQEVAITVDAYPDEKFRGTVSRIATKGANVSNVVTFEVKIEVADEHKALLKPEMTANVDIVTASARDTLVVPLAAVTKSRTGYVAHVATSLAAAGAAPERRSVTVGIRNDSTIEVLGGLAEGERVELAADAAESKWRSERRRGPFGPP